MKKPKTDSFQVGDVVQLKSGGPIMTVDRISEYGVRAAWFAYGKDHQCQFDPLALQRAAPRRARARGKAACTCGAPCPCPKPSGVAARPGSSPQ